jgi:hypothetical protein
LEKLQWGIPVIETGGTIAEKKNDEEESELRWTEDMSYPGTHKEDSDDSDESIQKDEMEEKMKEVAD